MAERVELRPGRPTLEDATAFARYLDQAAEGFFGFMLGPRSEQIVAKAYLVEGNDFSYPNVTFAEKDGAVVGMVSGYTAETHRRAASDALPNAAGFNLRFMAIGLMIAPLFRVLDNLDDGDFYILAVAVDPAARGHGIGRVLLDEIESRAAASGARHVALDVSAKNEGAKRLYERRGMSVISRWPKRIPLPGLKLLRMTKPVDGTNPKDGRSSG